MHCRSNVAEQPICALTAAVLLFTACSAQHATDAPQVKASVFADPNLFEVADPWEIPMVAAVTRQRPETLSVNGVVAPDVARTVHVNALAGGRVLEVRARLGDDVRKDQLLMLIRSSDLEQAIATYQKDQADEQLAKAALERARDLYAHGATSQQDLQNAENAGRKAEVTVKTDTDQIRLLGGDLEHLSPVIEVRSPITGAIVDQQIAGGEAVKSLDNSQSLFLVADLSRVWVLCDVYENDLGKVALGDSAEVRLNAFPDRVFRGTVGNISRVLDPATRTAKVRLELANAAGLFRPQMFATVKFTSRRKYSRLLLPATAILRLHDKDWVFIRQGDRSFRRVEVQAGAADSDGMQEVRSGLSPGDQVVANALQFSSAVAAE